MNLKYAGIPGCASEYSFRLLKHHQKCLMNVGIAIGRLQATVGVVPVGVVPVGVVPVGVVPVGVMRML